MPHRPAEETAAGDTTGPHTRAPWLSYALVLAVAASLYGPSLGYAFTYLDDYSLIAENQTFLSEPANLVTAFTEDGFSYLGGVSGGLYYRPMLWVSFILESQVDGSSLALRHGVNLLLHLVTCSGLLSC